MRLLAEYFTEDQMAKELGVSPRTLRNMRARRVGPPFAKLPGRSIVYNKAKAIAWINSIEQAPVRSRRAA
jgi:predicted DNA-binding transcriptional regulator YafY